MAVFWRSTVLVSTQILSKHTFSFLHDVLRSPITRGITSTVMFHSFFQLSSQILVFSNLFSYFGIHTCTIWNSKINNLAVATFLYYHNNIRLSIIWSVLLLILLFISMLPLMSGGYHRELSDSKSLQIFRTLLRNICRHQYCHYWHNLNPSSIIIIIIIIRKER